MTREQKAVAIEDLKAKLADSNIFYIADISGLNAEVTSNLRKACYKVGIKLEVVKNTLLTKAMEASDRNYDELPSTLKGNSAILFAEVANAPAKVIKEFRKKAEKPAIKGAYINDEVYVGENLLETLVAIKSKEEVIGEIIGLLQSPAQRVISALKNQFKDEE
ncbi:50S ribosomal protein L10 [Myroides injenensis]|uniref:50S ribosomal protein L10 n=1 Tax=Myroides injenensis TaxID=1183151 RepID=UPI00028A3999|nr:50S ribosomal protein L10 [Myroides injenensis]